MAEIRLQGYRQRQNKLEMVFCYRNLFVVCLWGNCQSRELENDNAKKMDELRRSVEIQRRENIERSREEKEKQEFLRLEKKLQQVNHV